MRVLLIGYGRMGKEVHEVLKERGHSVCAIIDEKNAHEISTINPEEVDVAIEFTIPETAFENAKICMEKQIPIATGTTGWNNKLDEAHKICNQNNATFLYASNFSLGVNILFAMNQKLAQIMNGQPQYTASIEETHHIHKKDKPSGTAVSLAEQIASKMGRYDGFRLDGGNENELTVKAHREGEVFGNHTIKYESDVDSLSLAHKAKSRKGFALGAVIAAEYISQRKGVYTMKDVLNIE